MSTGKPCSTAFAIWGISASMSGSGWNAIFVELAGWHVGGGVLSGG